MTEARLPEARLMELLQAEWKEAATALAPPAEATVLLRPPEQRMPLSPLALFAEIEDVRESWRRIFAQPRLAELAPQRFNTRWSLKDLLGHLSYWATEFAAEVRTAADDAAFDYAIPGVLTEKGPTDWNEKEVVKRRNATLDRVFEEYERASEALQDLVLQMPQPQLFLDREFPYSPSGDPAQLWHGPAAMVPYFKCMHDRYHFAQIEKWLAARK